MYMKKINQSLRTLLYTVFLILIQGCGQTGDLYLPEETNNIVEVNEYKA